MFIVSGSFDDCYKVFDSSGRFFYTKLEKKTRMMDSCPPWSLCIEKHGSRQNLLVCDNNRQ